MKTLVNKQNPEVKITAPDITLENHCYYLDDGDYFEFLERDWTLVEDEQPDKETILRICKLHKVWSIMAPWENVEDFVKANWNAENIV